MTQWTYEIWQTRSQWPYGSSESVLILRLTQLILSSIFVSVASIVIRLNSGNAVTEFSYPLAQLVCIKKALRISIIELFGLKAQMIVLGRYKRLAHTSSDSSER